MEENKNLSAEHSGTQPEQIIQEETAVPETGEQPVNELNALNDLNDNMEVHHHAHAHGKKSWKSYFWDFLMLFLAVFCGFLAEYQLEHEIEKDREKQYMTTLVEDLKDDISLAEDQITIHRQRISQNDSLIEMLSTDDPELVNRNDLYYFSRLGNRTVFFYNNDRTIEQMKYSGGFRLVRNKEISNMIMRYYRKIDILKMLERYDSEEQSGYKDFAVKIFDPLVFKNISIKAVITRPTGNPKLLTYDQQVLKEFAGKVQYLNGSRIRQLNSKEDIRISALDLIKQINKAYHLK